MTRYLLSFIFLIASSCLMAQHGCRTISTDSVELSVCYFTTGQMSTEIAHRISSAEWYTLKVYDLHSHKIYERNYGRRAGSSYVYLTYYPDGGVSTARYTMQPDGGVQHTDITTYFTTDGNVDREDDRSIGDDGQMHPGIVSPPAPSPSIVPAHTTNTPIKPYEYNPVPTSELFLTNYTSDKLHITVKNKDVAGSPYTVDVEPSDKIKLGLYSIGTSDDPLSHFDLHISNKVRKGYGYAFTRSDNEKKGSQSILVTVHKVK